MCLIDTADGLHPGPTQSGFSVGGLSGHLSQEDKFLRVRQSVQDSDRSIWSL